MTSTNWRNLITVMAMIVATDTAQATLLDQDVDWDNSFLFAGTGGIENPLVRVGFNPQPEPPAGGMLTFGTPPDSEYPPDPVITHSGDFNAGAPFRLLFGISNDLGLTILEGSIVDGPGDSSLLEFDVLNNLGALVFDVQLEFTTTSGGSPIDWVAFNPQPEPPAIGANGTAFGADFTFSSFSDASLAIRIHDAAGDIITLQQVPEPGTLLLLSVGIGLMGMFRKKARPM